MLRLMIVDDEQIIREALSLVSWDLYYPQPELPLDWEIYGDSLI